MAMMPKRHWHGASVMTTIMPVLQRRQWQRRQSKVRDEDSAMPASTPAGC
jgi:hypothetical protein